MSSITRQVRPNTIRAKAISLREVCAFLGNAEDGTLPLGTYVAPQRRHSHYAVHGASLSKTVSEQSNSVKSVRASCRF